MMKYLRHYACHECRRPFHWDKVRRSRTNPSLCTTCAFGRALQKSLNTWVAEVYRKEKARGY